MSDSSTTLNLGLNDGTYAPTACLEVLARYRERDSLRHYTDAGNGPLRAAIAKRDGVKPEHVFLHNGSGPILKQCLPQLVKQAILASPQRVLRHLVNKSGFPMITPRLTYSKVPKKAVESGLTVHLLAMRPPTFALDVAELTARVEARDGLVYLANPNNPTGNLLISRRELIPLLQRFPRSLFWIDEAYMHYLDPADYEPVSDLVPRYPNLLVSRTFSFAYGLAAARVGYLLASAERVVDFEKPLTDYRIGMLSEQLCLAALADDEHLPYVRSQTRAGVATLREGLSRCPGVENFPSQANFVLARFTDGRRGEFLRRELANRGILIKAFEAFGAERYDEYFRITVGLPEENERVIAAIHELLGVGGAG